MFSKPQLELSLAQLRTRFFQHISWRIYNIHLSFCVIDINYNTTYEFWIWLFIIIVFKDYFSKIKVFNISWNSSVCSSPPKKKQLMTAQTQQWKTPSVQGTILSAAYFMNRKCPICHWSFMTYHLITCQAAKVSVLQSSSGHQQLTAILGQLPVTAYQSKYFGIFFKLSWWNSAKPTSQIKLIVMQWSHIVM